MDAKERATKIRLLLNEYGSPLGADDEKLIVDCIMVAEREARAAGYAEAIEAAARVADENDEPGGATTAMRIRALTPATTKEPK